MSHPNPLHDPENVYPHDDYRPEAKKKKVAKKMRPKKPSAIDELKRLIKEGEELRSHPFAFKSKGYKHMFGDKRNLGENLPPGYRDSDNE